MQLAALAAVVSYFWSDVRGVVAGSLGGLRASRFRCLGVPLRGLDRPRHDPGGDRRRASEAPAERLRISGPHVSKSSASPASSWASCSPSRKLSCRHRRTLAQMTLLDALAVGIAQVGALIPGVSRSGSTLTAALFLESQAGRGGPVLVPARAAVHRACRTLRVAATRQGAPRGAGLVRSCSSASWSARSRLSRPFGV